VYWLVFFSIVVHGLSIPVNNLVYRAMGVKPIVDAQGPTEKQRLRHSASVPKDSTLSLNRRDSVVVRNSFSGNNTRHGVTARDMSQDVELGFTLDRESTTQSEDPFNTAWRSGGSIVSCSEM
jgi:hypothetical protein